LKLRRILSNFIEKVIQEFEKKKQMNHSDGNLERTDLEIYATGNFEKDVIDMLRILPDFSIPFQKFIPSYQ
jgi:hypothetical protein